MKYDQVEDGKWFFPKRKGFREQCCDCGLVHVIDYRIRDGHIEFRARRDDKATAAVRKAFKFKGDEE